MKREKPNLDFSIVLPTYSGIETIERTFNSLLKQESAYKFELVVVIDGPNKKLFKICSRFKYSFKAEGVSMRIIQFEKNKGRFEARIVGAKESTSNQILFVDDRIELREGYFEQLKALNAKVAMPNVIEVEDKIRPISLTLRLIRKRLYGKTWGADFEDYYIDQSNFERSPKGAAALWISKQSFLAACEEVAGDQGIGKYTNEDTRVLRVIVDAGEKILRSSKLVIYYRPRSTFKSETLHLYGRGPRFIDYYLRPGTRFFVPIIVFYLSLIALMALLIVSPSMFLLVIGTILLIAILLASYLASFGSQTLTVLVGLLLIVFAFGVGIIKGTWIALKS